MDCSIPGFLVLHYLPEFAQIHVYWIYDVIQPSHPLLSTSAPAFNLSQYQGLFQWVGSSYQFSSVQFSHSVVSDSLRPHESQHTRPPCPSPSPRVHSNSRPSSRWCHPAISSSVIPFSSCLQSLPESESFPISQFFTWGGQSTGVSALASFLPRNTRADLLQNGLVGSPCSPRDSQSLLQHHSSKASSLWRSAFFTVQFSHPYMTTGKTIALTRWTFVGKIVSLLFNMLSRLAITFLPRSKCLLISWLHIRWPKYWSFNFSISPSNEYSELIYFRVLVWSPCSPRDSQASCPTPQFKSINS